MNKHKQQPSRTFAEEAFRKSLKQLQELPDLQKSQSKSKFITPNEHQVLAKAEIADWEDAGADLEQFFQRQSSE